MSDSMSDRGQFVLSNVVLSNVDLDRLAASEAVKAFMARVADDYTDPRTGEVFSASLAEAAANVFELFEDDGFQIPARLYEVAKGGANDIANDVSNDAARRRR